MAILQNDPTLWRDKLPVPDPKGHKYDRGYALIYGGPEKTGAARLAARACARVGTGLTSICTAAGKGDLYRMEIEPHLMVSDTAFERLYADDRITAGCLGPGAGFDIGQPLKSILLNDKPAVLDADALTFMAQEGADDYFAMFHRNLVLTPHEGEFKRLFGDMDVAMAAKKAGCTILLKGAETRIAVPDETLIVNYADAPWLATAGSGDVLAGMITGFMAQGMETKWAAAAAVWIHAEAGAAFGRGMVASDLPEMIPPILQKLAG